MTTRKYLRVDKYLTDFGVGYSQNEAGRFIASQILFNQKVGDVSGKYPIFTKADWFRSEMTIVGRYDPSPEAHPGLSNDSYFCDEFRLKVPLSAKDLAEDEIGLKEGTTRYLVEQALLARDLKVATEIFATGKWTSVTEQTGVAAGPTGAQFLQWNDASSTPITDVNTAKEAVRAACGFEANVMIISPPVKNALLEHPDVLDRYKYTTGGSPSLEDLRNALKLDNIIVGAAVRNSAREGATAVQADVFGKHALFLYVPKAMTKYTPKPVTGFSWTPYDNVSVDSASIRSWQVDDPQGEYLEAEQAFGVKITANDAGVFYGSAVA